MSLDTPNGEPIADEPVTIPTEAAEPASSMVTVARPGRGRLLPWLAGGAVAAAAIAIAIVVLVSGRSAGLDVAAGYVPTDAVFYMEAQLDLPSGQRETLRGILERFPAATPDDLLGPALADTLDEALASSDAGFTYSGDIAPWFTGRVALSSEGGHASLSASDATEDRLLSILRRWFGDVSFERVLSGDGIVNLYRAQCAMAGIEAAPHDAATVSELAAQGTDASCGAAMDRFFGFLGTFAGNLALTFDARGGVFLAGGIAAKNQPFFTDGRFVAAFLRKGRFQEMLGDMPIDLIVNEKVGLIGAAEMARRVG